MRLLVANHIRNANEALRANRLRTLLTILGITLGVACMTTIMVLSYGATELITRQVDDLGGNIAVIRPGAPHEPASIQEAVSTMAGESFSASSLTEHDFEAVRRTDGVVHAAPLMSITAAMTSSTETVRHSPIVATTPSFNDIARFELREGQFLEEDMSSSAVVIGNQLAINLFGTEQAIGKTMRIHGQQFTVLGVLAPVKSSVHYNNFDANRAAFISLENGKSFNQGVAQIRQINVQAKDADTLGTVTKELTKKLTETHHNETDFTVLRGKSIAEPTSRLFSTIGITTSIVAAVSLLIGGIGIMNIMLVGVAERTREIGIRKTVGASNYHITIQFLIESLAMSVSGGILGLVLGYGAALAVSSMLPFAPGISWHIPVASLGVSILVGTLFGLYPALRAAGKDPIVALRQYH